MTLAIDNATNSPLGTTDRSWTHVVVGIPKAIMVFVVQAGGIDHITGVTYGGIAMTEVSGSPVVKTNVEGGTAYGYFLGTAIPTGNQTVVASVGGATGKIGFCISITGGGDTEIIDTDTISSDSLENPSGTLLLTGRSCFCAEAFVSGADTAADISPLTNWTSRAEADPGDILFGLYHYDIIGTADVTTGATAAADDIVLIAMACAEKTRFLNLLGTGT